MLHLFLRDLVEGALFVAAPVVAAQPCPGNVGAIAVGADEIGVERHDVAGANDIAAAFLEPWIGARPGRQQAGLNPLRPPPHRRFPEDAPEFQFRHAGLQRRAGIGQRVEAGGHGTAHGLDLLGRLDRPAPLDDRLGVENGEIVRLQRVEAPGGAMVERQPAVAAAMAPDQVGDLGRPVPVHLPANGRRH